MRTLAAWTFVAILTLSSTRGTLANPAHKSDTIPSARQKELVHLVRQDCGSCHGMRLTGGLGTPLTPERMREMPVETLVSVILLGRPGTAMPPWKSLLTENDAEWIARELQKGFPEEVAP